METLIQYLNEWRFVWLPVLFVLSLAMVIHQAAKVFGAGVQEFRRFWK